MTRSGRALKMANDLTGREVQCEADIRRVLDDNEIDAISIATPNHWHSLMTVWACQAGKDIYVENLEGDAGQPFGFVQAGKVG